MKPVRLLLLSLAALCPLGAAIAAGHPGHWRYEGDAGPAMWGSVQKEFETCKLGTAQSPIDIRSGRAEKADLPPLKTSYRSSAAELVNNGHTIQVDLADAGSTVFPSGSYELLQFHFHTPSEETIDGKSYPLVAHLVHRNAAGKLAVIAVLFRAGKPNTALAGIFAALPREEGRRPLESGFDATSLLPAASGYYAFNGSLTTPPCSEGVAWHVFKTPIEISRKQIEAFRGVFKMNARPVQPLNGRKVQVVD